MNGQNLTVCCNAAAVQQNVRPVHPGVQQHADHRGQGKE